MTTKTRKGASLKKAIEDTKAKAENLKKHVKESQRHLDGGFSDDSSFAQEEFNAEVYEMSPTEALDILKYRNSIIKDDEQLNTNRRIDSRIVERIKDEILNDDWYEEAANIAFNKDEIRNFLFSTRFLFQHLDRVTIFDNDFNLIGDTDTLDLDPRSFGQTSEVIQMNNLNEKSNNNQTLNNQCCKFY